ncbi:TM0106 family RecB-like putative nuclease [Calothrix sp. PCC 7507]|uniref:TM0106 family RecB-like putative nuclease n=1 Tax=Calothrix sp. PCC 7507 TaxID=99598 RepID=UPI00029F2E17|nr:TM0106 family RecB-like putative nuclease [Calothrix sp. PCC 7507]AFY36271.1 RecB family nuclease, putative [Calothrix sp. PCC 7507]
MLINAELLLQYQRCKRRPFLDIHGDRSQRDVPNELLLKLQQDKIAYQLGVLAEFTYSQPDYPKRNWAAGQAATLELMQRGVEYIRQGVLLVNYNEWSEDIPEFPRDGEYTLLSRPDLLIKQPGESRFGDWMYVPASLELGKRPKQEYQVVAAFHAQVLGTVQGTAPDIAWLKLRTKDTGYEVDLLKWTPQMQLILAELIQALEAPNAPEVFISRQKCTLCPWYSQCYAIAQSQKHLSLLPGVSPLRYTQLQTLSITTLESLANTSPSALENLLGFDSIVAPKLVVQAQSVLENRPFILPYPLPTESITFTAPIEIYFDIEAQPDLNLNYLLGVLVVDTQAKTEKFYSFLAERPEEEESIWQQFLDLVGQYPEAPIYHFCVYEFDTVKRLAKLYRTPYSSVNPILNRFVDVYEQLTQSVALPIESYALKAIARWLGFEWRNPEATGAKCIYWYDQWLETGDRTLLETIQLYNEDDCRATHSVKDWLVNFF